MLRITLQKQISRTIAARRRTPRTLGELQNLMLRQDPARLVADMRKAWAHSGGSGGESQFRLTIEGIEPPQAWGIGQTFRVGYNLLNQANQPTSGLIYGTVTQGIQNILVSARWFQAGTRVTDLQPGQAFLGVVEMRKWTSHARVPGSIEVNLEYWAEVPEDDPTGMITFVWGLPGEQQYATYAPGSFVQDSFEARALSFAADIRPFFRDIDIQAMRYLFDLSSYEDVKKNAKQIYDVVAHPTPSFRMPCDGAWPADKVAIFKQWMDDSMPP